MTRVALLATGRSTFVQEAGRSFHRRAVQLLRDLGTDMYGPDHLIEDAEAVGSAGFTPAGAEACVLLCATFADASVALAAFGGSRRPVVLWAVRDPAPTGDRLYLNSLCGANLAAHALVQKGVPVRLVYGDPEEARVRADLEQALNGDLQPERIQTGAAGQTAPLAEVEPLLRDLRGRVLGVVGEAPLGFTTCQYDAACLRQTLGLEVATMTLDDAFDRIRAVPWRERRQVVAAAAKQSPSLAQLPEAEVDRFGAVTVALREWVVEANLSALALRCWPEFPLQLGVCPCSALGRLAAQGVVTSCEADVNGAATMLLMRSLDPERGINYLADVVDVDIQKNTATFWHCGLAPVELAADPDNARQDLHCNRGIGVAGNFALKPGRVTIARISRSADHRRLLLAGGEALPGPNRFKGNSVDVLVDGDAEGLVRTIVEGGFEHHTVLAWGELRPRLRTASALLGLELVEFSNTRKR